MNELDVLARKYGTDKQTNEPGTKPIYHGYTPVYDELFKDKRDEFQHFLEIGVREGWSHQMWYDYFPNAMIYGLDLADEIPAEQLKSIENDRIQITVGDQSDEKLLIDTYGDKEFDCIIDDGSHRCWHHQQTFKYLFPFVKSGGYYIIEDLGVCGIREFREHDDIRSSTTTWLSGIQRGEFFSYYIQDGDRYLNEIELVQVVGELGIIRKK